MKSGRYFFILFLILLIMPAYAQKGVDITGTVIEEGTNEPIEQATVRLLSVKDSSMIGGVATSRNGSFMLKNIKNGSYLLHVSFVGFDPLYQPRGKPIRSSWANSRLPTGQFNWAKLS